jgi:hypothetical protein
MGRKKKVEAEVPATDVVAAVEQILDPQPVAEQPPKKEAALYSSEKGSIACKDHAPIKGSDTWRFDRWKPMTADDVEAFERELGHKIACETCAAVKRNEATDATPPVEAQPEAPKKKGKSAKADLALATFCEHYLTHLAESGKSLGTCFSYRLELKTALDALGAETKLGDLAPAQVLVFFGSDKVNKTRTGRPKSPLSISKTQRVLRLALVWAQEKGWIEKAPLPEQAATH